MRYAIFVIVISVILLVISFLNISIDLFKITGFVISSTVQPQKLLKSIDYEILNTIEGRNDITILIKFYGNISNLCINEIKINNVSKEFSYKEITEKVYEIVIKNTSKYDSLYIRLCDGKIINETKYE